MKRTEWAVALSLWALMTACDARGADETRTFSLTRLSGETAAEIIGPYLDDGDRVTAAGSSLTVRTSPERLAEIEGALRRIEGERRNVELRFQLVRANGVAAADPRIADIESELRDVFRFDGYSLVATGVISATQHAEFSHALRSEDGREYRIFGRVGEIDVSDTTRAAFLDLSLLDPRRPGSPMSTGIGITDGKFGIIGSTVDEGDGALILVVRARIE